MHKIGPTQKKILLILLGGVALGLSGSPRQYFRTFRSLRREWARIDQRSFRRSFKNLSREKLVEEKISSDGSFSLVLTSEGKRRAKLLELFGRLDGFKRPNRWDKKWRIVLFDIPEKDRVFRDILREHLKNLDFYKLQQSVFISPWPIERPILGLIGIYEAEPYVRVITAETIDNEEQLKKHFFKQGRKKPYFGVVGVSD